MAAKGFNQTDGHSFKAVSGSVQWLVQLTFVSVVAGSFLTEIRWFLERGRGEGERETSSPVPSVVPDTVVCSLKNQWSG